MPCFRPAHAASSGVVAAGGVLPGMRQRSRWAGQHAVKVGRYALSSSSSSYRIAYRAHQCQRGLTGIEAGMLYDDRNIRIDYAGVIGIVWNRLGIGEFVEANMLGA